MGNARHVFRRSGVIGTCLDSGAHFARHTHDAFGVGLIERGAQKSWSGRGQVEAGPGDIITVNPGEVHDGAPVDGRRRWRMLYIEPQVVSAYAFDLTEGRKGVLEFQAPVFAGDATLRTAFANLFRRLSGGEDLASPGCEAAMLELLSLIGAGMAPRDGTVSPVTRAKRLIDDRPQRRLRLDELARLSGQTKFQFIRAFKRATGLTPHAYIGQRRLQRAKRLIETGETIAAAAMASGYADQSHLTRHFAASYGFTPGSLQK